MERKTWAAGGGGKIREGGRGDKRGEERRGEKRRGGNEGFEISEKCNNLYSIPRCQLPVTRVAYVRCTSLAIMMYLRVNFVKCQMSMKINFDECLCYVHLIARQ